MKNRGSWLDPQTLEMLRREPPHKMAPPSLPDYSLVLLETGRKQTRMVRAIRRVNGCPDSVARELLARRSPVVVNPDLSYHDALLGQFEFICCDAITVIIPTEVVTDDERSYLDELYAMLRRSDEFEEVTLRVDGVPRSEDGIRFLDQFLGIVEPEIGRFPMDLRMLYKKARIMTHWGNRIGAQVRVTADSDQE